MKPDDEGEDTISIHVQNDAWACLDMTLTSNDDNSSTEPELQVDEADILDNTLDGELADNIQMFWWADDGDNVYEENDTPLMEEPQTVADMFGEDGTFSVPLADAENNAWSEKGPIPADSEGPVYIAKAWCMGTMTLDPVEGDEGENPSVDPGVICDGKLLGNETQTDGIRLDIAFRAQQARNNPDFLCDPERTRFAKIIVTKEVINNDGGNNTVQSFQLFVGNVGVTSGVQMSVPVGSYEVSELGASGYEATFGGDCDADGNITLEEGGEYECTITNDDIKPNVTLIKNVVNNDTGSKVATDFKMRVNGVLVPSGGSRSVNSNTNVTITEDASTGYTPVGITGVGCPANLGDIFQLNEGVAITCTITNDDNAI